MFIGIIIAIMFMTYINTFNKDFNDSDLGIITMAVIIIMVLSVVISLI